MKKVKVVFWLLLITLLGCQSEGVGPDNSARLRPLTSNEQEIIRSSNEFAFNIFNQVNQSNKNRNIFISPFSISMGLGMAYYGTSDSTQELLRDKLGFNFMGKNEINKGFFELSELLKNMDKEVVLNMANGLWYREEFEVEPFYRDIIAAYYNAHVEKLDFYKSGVNEKINDWVAEKTNNKIEGIVDQVHPEDLMYLVNAIYFKADWAYPFDQSVQGKQSFFPVKGREVTCDMMYTSRAKYQLYQDEEKAVIDIPYGNKQFSMTILMPHGDITLQQLQNNLSGKQLNKYLNLADSTNRALLLPKFNISSKITLKHLLSSMGLDAPFRQGANFSGLFQNISHTNISDIIHKAEIEVNEESTEAISYTGEEVNPSFESETLTVNRPFFFFIREKHSGVILFAGKFVSPVV